MNINRIYYPLVGIFLIFSILAGCSGETNGRKKRSKAVIPVRTLSSVTARLNSKCPELVDEDTRLDSISLTAEGLSYHYTLIKRDKISISEQAFRAYLIPLILDNVHFNPDLKMYRDSSVTMIFIYWDRNGELITEISLGPESYL